MRPRPGDLLLVRWEDAQHVSGDWAAADTPVPPVIVETVGWLVSIDKRDLRLAAQVEPKSRAMRCLNVIPRGIVRSVRRLERGRR